MTQSFIKPLSLGKKVFPNNIIQGPLAGISCAPFRALTWRYSQPAFTCTEMISAKTLIHSSQKLLRRYTEKSPQEGPVCFQIASNNPLEVAEAVKKLNDLNADLIDLNCGCPMNKIRRKGTGSSLLSQASKIYQLISAMKNNTDKPVSIKIRVEGNSNDKFHLNIAKAVRDAGADFLIVHGRHWSENYDTTCHYDHIQFFVNELTIPIIGNGDIACLITLKKMFMTGCAGVMVSRAGVGQPWLIAQLMAEMQNMPFMKPLPADMGNIFIEHITQLSQLLGNETLAVLQARKFAKYYARHLINRTAFCDTMNHCKDIRELKNICANYFMFQHVPNDHHTI